ncbi:MAG: extracellular solute-binding protein [Clostridiales bacterium]|nr:extracellular solute-binding protein [Clostridiales bacterium]
MKKAASRKYTAPAALVLSLALLLSGLAGCKKKAKAEVPTVKETDPFFDVSEMHIVIPTEEGRDVETIDIDQTEIRFVGNMISIPYCSVHYKMPAELKKQMPNMEYDEFMEVQRQYSERFSVLFDLDGNLIRKAALSGGDEGVSYEEYILTSFENDKGETMALVNREGTTYLEKVLDNGQMEQVMTVEYAGGVESDAVMLPDGRIVVGHYDGICVIGSDGKLLNSAYIEEFNGQVFYQDGKLYASCYHHDFDDEANNYHYLQEYDLNTFNFVGDKIQCNHGYSLVKAAGGLYYVNSNGIIKADLIDATKDEEIFSWTNTDYNYMNMRGSEPRIISDQEIYFLNSTLKEEGDGYVTTVSLVHAVKAEKNPYAGKKILTIGTCETTMNLDDVIRYNTNPDAQSRIMVHDYSADLHMSGDYMNKDAALSDKIYLDIVSGNGPDMLVNFSQFSQFNSDQVMVDLNPLIDATDGTGLDRSLYFDNILRASEEGGKLYHMPITFGIVGFLGNATLLGSDTSWTYEKFDQQAASLSPDISVIQEMEYKELLELLLSESNEHFIDYSGKTVNFESDEFKELLTFVKKYGSPRTYAQRMQDEDFYESYLMFENGRQAWYPYLWMFNVQDYVNFRNKLDGPEVFCGVPSSSGGALAANMNLTIGVSKYSANQKESWDFIRYILQTQESEGTALSEIPISRSALEKENEALIRRYEERLKTWEEYSEDPNTRPVEITKEHTTELVTLVESVGTVKKSDPTVLLIIIEEAPAFFTGQQTLDAVCKTIQNRTQTVVQER